MTDQKQQQLGQNKKNVIAFYDLAFNQNNPSEAIMWYAGDVCIQHNLAMADDNETFREYFDRMEKEFLDKHVHLKRAIAEGN